MRILIKGGRVIDPGRVNGPADVLIENGKIVAVGQKLDPPAGKADPSTTIIDAPYSQLSSMYRPFAV